MPSTSVIPTSRLPRIEPIIVIETMSIDLDMCNVLGPIAFESMEFTL
jgi:hypothetical protein